LLFFLTLTQTQLIIPNCAQILDITECNNTDGCTTTVCNGTFQTWPSSCNFTDIVDCQAGMCQWNGCQGNGPSWTCPDFFQDPITCSAHSPNCTWDYVNMQCAGNYTPQFCSDMYNLSMCVTAISCDWVNNTCVGCESGSGNCSSNTTFQGYKPCSQIHESLCMGTNGCKTSCTGNPVTGCMTSQDPVSCTNLPGCFWRLNTCFGSMLNIASNCITAPTSVCTSNGCNIVPYVSLLNGSLGPVCTNAPCFNVMNPDLCNAIVGCYWDTGFCYIGSEKLMLPLMVLAGTIMVYLLQ